MFVVEVAVQVSYFVLGQEKIFLKCVLKAQPVIQVAQFDILVDQTHNLHVILSPVTVHELNLDLYYLSRVFSDIRMIKLSN